MSINNSKKESHSPLSRLPHQASRELPASLPRVAKKFDLNAQRSGSKITQILSDDEILNAEIAGVSLGDIKNAIYQSRAREQRLQILAPTLKKRHEARVEYLKGLLNGERAARGEVRGSKMDKEYILGILTTKDAVEKIENILPNMQKDRANADKMGKDDFTGLIDEELRRTHDRLLPSVRNRLADGGSQKKSEALQKRVMRVLSELHKVSLAEEAINRHAMSGKPIGMGLPGFSSQAVVSTEGVKIYGGGVRKASSDGADVTIGWEEIAGGSFTVGVAPSSLDGLANLIHRISGIAIPRSATVVLTEAGTGRPFAITAPNGHQLAEDLRKHAKALAQKPQVDAELENLLLDKEDGHTIRQMLKSLDNS